MTNFLPHCNRRYSVSNTGFIYDCNGPIERTLIDGEWYVYINWINGFDHYKVSLLVLLTFTQLDLSSDDWLRVIPLHYDGDVKNVKLSNLTYRYDGLIENEHIRGFYHIPFYPGYLINEAGDLYSTYSKKLKKWTVTEPNESRNSKGGYFYTRLKISGGCITTTMFRHRLLLLVFKPYSANVLSMVVNHINGIPGDDCLDNLEWSTYRDNNTHAFRSGLRPNSVREVKVKDLSTGTVITFGSVAEAARSYGFDNATAITYRIRNAPDKVFPDMLLFKYAEDNTLWPDVDLTKVNRSGKAHSVFVYNVYDCKSYYFDKSTDASNFCKVSVDTITSAIRNNSYLPLNGYIFRYSDLIGTVPVFNNDQLEIMKLNPMRVRSGYKVTLADGSITYMTNAKDVAKLKDVKESIYIDIYSPVAKPNPLELTGKPLVMNLPS